MASKLYTISPSANFSEDDLFTVSEWIEDRARLFPDCGLLLSSDRVTGKWYFDECGDTYISEEGIREIYEEHAEDLAKEDMAHSFEEFLEGATAWGGTFSPAPDVVYAWSADGIGFSPDAWREDLEDALDDVACFFCDGCHSARRHAVTIWRIALPG